MMHNQPDVIQQKLLTRLAELQLLIARHRGLAPPLNLNTLYQMNTLGQMLESSEDMLMSAFLAGLEVGSTKKLKRLTKELARSSSVTVELSALVALEQADGDQLPGLWPIPVRKRSLDFFDRVLFCKRSRSSTRQPIRWHEPS